VPDAPSGNLPPTRPHRKKHRHLISKPLKVTPPLGLGAYVFPVVGVSGYSDSYGAFRGDVHGKWHHGDDIFAALGAPVVAVANGTINRVGWHKRGGWRLWVRDTAANQFYYAHLSGYAPRVFRTRHVRAGDVLGFVGNTGDAFASPPHLHFEVHPHQLLRLRYDGAVDPTTYLNSWPRVRSVQTPFPVHPRLPRHTRFRISTCLRCCHAHSTGLRSGAYGGKASSQTRPLHIFGPRARLEGNTTMTNTTAAAQPGPVASWNWG